MTHVHTVRGYRACSFSWMFIAMALPVPLRTCRDSSAGRAECCGIAHGDRQGPCPIRVPTAQALGKGSGFGVGGQLWGHEVRSVRMPTTTLLGRRAASRVPGRRPWARGLAPFSRIWRCARAPAVPCSARRRPEPVRGGLVRSRSPPSGVEAPDHLGDFAGHPLWSRPRTRCSTAAASDRRSYDVDT